jgi:hypothetical protein
MTPGIQVLLLERESTKKVYGFHTFDKLVKVPPDLYDVASFQNDFNLYQM